MKRWPKKIEVYVDDSGNLHFSYPGRIDGRVYVLVKTPKKRKRRKAGSK